jgi:hypothetical protein
MASFGNLNSCNITSATTGGVLAQIIALGAADTHLTADPDVSFWRLRIQKCTNFAMESILQNFTGEPTWGSEVSLKLNRTGDLVYWMYVLLDIPAIAAVPGASGENCAGRFPCCDPCDPCGDGDEVSPCADYVSEDLFDVEDLFDDGPEDDIDTCTGLKRPYANWVNEIGHAAIARASFSIGGQIIDTVYNHYLHMWEELSGKPGKRLEEMIGKRSTVAALVADSQFERRLYVPLPFYFTRHSGNALPLVSLQFHSLDVQVCFSPLNKMIQVSDCDAKVVRCQDGQPVCASDIHALLDTTYVYLDMDERDRFATGSFQQLITQVQQYATTARNGSINAQLNFNHPTLELIWAVQRKCQSDCNNTFNYSGAFGRDPIRTACLRLNNLQRFHREGQYFRLVQPYEKHTNIPKSFIYNYSFALDPESCQPQGSLNFSRIDNVEMNISLQAELATEETALYVFARSWNVLRFRNGLGGTLYANILGHVTSPFKFV